MKKVMILTGPAGDAQGWGDMEVTRQLCDTLNTAGKAAEIVYIENRQSFKDAIENRFYDIIWSALYHISSKADIVGLNEDDGMWIADILDSREIPYIGPNARTMKQLIQKNLTHAVLQHNHVPVPQNFTVDIGGKNPEPVYPVFVKPSCESRSVGISDDSVANTPEDLEKAINYIHTEFEQPALVEEYLPGDEYTVLMLSNGRNQEFLPGIVKVDASHYGKYPILRSDLRGVGLTKIYRPATRRKESIELAGQAVEALNCLDHVRVDMRVAADGQLKIIEVNGIPGLKPVKSWSPQIYSLYHASPGGEMAEYHRLVHLIVESGFSRYGI
ncbi:MAG: ATP-grasp domain-containing protein [Deltaproteobacteria bacterium]|nr:ATP-grasp domain-containing protein [Deltaproteobacteria bacterium]MBW2676558.1 ATP-grasp domain-containing protein [Deltaproteobacteria bacterium]